MSAEGAIIDDEAVDTPRARRRRALAYAALPAVRLGVPGKSLLMKTLGVYDDALWEGAGFGRVRCKWHGGVVELNLSEKWERQAYFLARYHELPLQLLMRACLRPGEVFLDVGANLGLVSMLGAWLVGERGRVHAFEPNPDVAERMRGNLERSGVRNVEVHQVALADAPGEMTLTVVGANTGAGTLGAIPPKMRGHVSASHRVQVMLGDRFGMTPSVIKIDAEGAEVRVLRGLERTLGVSRPLIVAEVNPFALRMNGTTARELRALMGAAGYRGWELTAARSGLLGWRASLIPLREETRPGLRDEVWAHPESAQWGRVSGFIEEN